MKRPVISVMLAIGVAIVAAAPASAQYYITREGMTGPCKVVDSQPLDKKTIVGGGRTYESHAAATKELPLLCKSE